MAEKTSRYVILILVSGILNCLLAVAHQVVVYFTYLDYQALITPEAEPVLKDFLLFSIGIGVVLLFVGLLTIYCYRGIKRGQRWGIVIGGGISVFLLVVFILITVITGADQPVAYVHLLNSLLVGVPVMLNRGLLVSE